MLNLSFGGMRIPSFINITDITETITPTLSATKFKTTFGERVITISFKIKRDMFITKEQKVELLNFIKGDNFGISKLILPNNTGRYYMAKVTKVSDLSGGRFFGEGDIEFTCHDYKEYDVNRTSHNSNNGNLTVKYAGTENIYPTVNINVTGSCNKIKIDFSNSSSSNYLEFNGNFKNGDKIVVNQATNKVTLNNNVNPQIWHLSSKRNMLINGTNTYNLVSGTATFSVEYNTAYL